MIIMEEYILNLRKASTYTEETDGVFSGSDDRVMKGCDGLKGPRNVPSLIFEVEVDGVIRKVQIPDPKQFYRVKTKH